MALALTHTFVCAVPDDGTPAGGVQPSHWNAALSTSMATGKVLGRTAAGTGEIEELGTSGSGNVAFTTSPTFVTPILGTPTSGTLTNCTGLPAAGVVGTAAILGANIFTALQTITQASANAGILASTGYSLTGTNTVRAVDIAGTWNGTGLTDFMALRITNTAAHASSKAFNIYAGASGATSMFSVDKIGDVTGPGGRTWLLQNQAYDIGIVGGLWVYSHGNTTGGPRQYFSYDGNCRTTNVGSWGWAAALDATASSDTALARNAAGVVEVNNGTAGTFRDMKVRGSYVAPSSANAQTLGLLCLTELTTIAAAATTDTTIQMPAGAVVMAVSARVTTAIPDATTFDVGDSGSATRFSTASVAVAANSTDAGTKAGAYYNAGALSVRLTMNGTPPAANTGRVRVTIYYFLSTPPTS